MEFIGRITVQSDKKERIKKILLTVGLAVLIISIIIELIIGNYICLSLIIPFIYLLNIRDKMGKKIYFKDVAILVVTNGEKICLEVSNCEYCNKILYSARFTISNEADINIKYNIKDEKTIINCVAKKDLFRENIIISSFAKQKCCIELFLKSSNAKKMANEFRVPLYMR